MDTTTQPDNFSSPQWSGAPVKPAQIACACARHRPACAATRAHDDKLTLFESTGSALLDVARAAAIHRRTVAMQQDVHFFLNL